MNNFEKTAFSVSNILRALRLKGGYKSYEKFAYINEISRIQYWKMESGNNFTLKSLLKVLDAHKISFDEFCSMFLDQTKKMESGAYRLYQIMEEFNINKKELSLKLGYKNTTPINHVLVGRNDISVGMSKRIVKSFPALSYDWIISGKGKMNTVIV